jgi:hypothetical protein
MAGVIRPLPSAGWSRRVGTRCPNERRVSAGGKPILGTSHARGLGIPLLLRIGWRVPRFIGLAFSRAPLSISGPELAKLVEGQRKPCAAD